MFSYLLKTKANFFRLFTHQEWTIISTLLIANFVNTITFNCMDAFYPKEVRLPSGFFRNSLKKRFFKESKKSFLEFNLWRFSCFVKKRDLLNLNYST